MRVKSWGQVWIYNNVTRAGKPTFLYVAKSLKSWGQVWIYNFSRSAKKLFFQT
jgi:hypothetical protein